MINIYTGESHIPRSKEMVSLNSPYFELHTKHQALTQQDITIIKTIEKGNTENLSAGCKTVLNILHYPNVIFDTAECSPIAIRLLCTIDNISFLCKNMPPIIEAQTPIQIDNSITLTSSKEYFDWWCKHYESV